MEWGIALLLPLAVLSLAERFLRSVSLHLYINLRVIFTWDIILYVEN